MTTLIKQPSESFLYDFDFTGIGRIPTDTIVSVNSLSSDTPGLTIGAPIIATPVVQVRISGGVAATSYKLTCLATTTAGDILEVDGVLLVRDL